MDYSVEICATDREREWERLAGQSDGSTLFHRLEFLKYHQDRFKDLEHNLFFLKGDHRFGIMPLAIFEEEGYRVAKSPYGGSFGGPVFEQRLNYSGLSQSIEALLQHLSGQSIKSLFVTLPMSAYFVESSDTLRFVLLESGFKCINRDLAHFVNLSPNRDLLSGLNMRVRNKVKKARKTGLVIKNRAPVEDFYGVLVKNQEKLGLKPTHTLEELVWLFQNLPERVYFDVAYLESVPIAGICFFVTGDKVNSSFYLSQDPAYQNLQALSLLIAEALVECQKSGFQWFDFGTSSQAQVARPNLFSFKENFGAIGQFRETYVWEA